jgi:putative flippase GtrA
MFLKKLWERYSYLFFEILRFGIVGGVSFLVDWSVLMLVLKLIFGGAESVTSITVSTAAGFVVGVTVNYILSIAFVFRNAKEGAGRDAKSAILFLVIAVIGLVLTQLIMNFGVLALGYNETLVKIAATLIVMVWNYISRKTLIFKS